MSEAVYQKLLDTASNPLRLDNEVFGEQPAGEHAGEPPEGPGPEPVLPAGRKVPDWWEIPSPGASTEEIKAVIRRNLEKLVKRREPKIGGWNRVF